MLDAAGFAAYPPIMAIRSRQHTHRARRGAGHIPRPATQIDLVLFDLDDTLCDYAGARELRLEAAFAAALESIPAGSARPLVDDLIAESIAIHPHASDHFPEVLRPHGVSAEAASAAIEWYRTNRYHGLKLFAETVETLAALRAAAPSRPIGLVTNGPAETQRAKIALLELDGLVDFAVVSGEFGVEKPDETIFVEAMRQGGATAEATIFAGDSPAHDIAGAKGAGIFAVWVNRTGAPWTLGDPRPDATISTLHDILDLVVENVE